MNYLRLSGVALAIAPCLSGELSRARQSRRVLLQNAVQGFPTPTDLSLAVHNDESRAAPHPIPQGEQETLERLGVDHLNPEPVAIALGQIEQPFCQFCGILDGIIRVLIEFWAMDWLADAGLLEELLTMHAMKEVRQGPALQPAGIYRASLQPSHNFWG